MIKAVGLIKRKPGLSRQEFARHYEEIHAPLALTYFPTFRRYVRNHVITSPASAELEFDCITEIWFDTVEDRQAVFDVLNSPIARIIHDDEETFMDTSKRITFLVEEKISR